MTPKLDECMNALLKEPCWIADLLPRQVPGDRAGRYFAVERYFRRPERRASLRRKQGELLLRLNCYADMVVSWDGCESWETNPEPEDFVRRLETVADSAFLRVLFPERETMADLDPGDTWMTVYSRDPAFLETFRQLAAAAGLFLWQPPAN